MKQLWFCSISVNIRMDVSSCFVLACLHPAIFCVMATEKSQGLNSPYSSKGLVAESLQLNLVLTTLISAQDLQSLSSFQSQCKQLQAVLCFSSFDTQCKQVMSLMQICFSYLLKLHCSFWFAGELLAVSYLKTLLLKASVLSSCIQD